MQALTGTSFWPVDFIWPVVQPMHAMTNGSSMEIKSALPSPADSTFLLAILATGDEPFCKMLVGLFMLP
jgi:hypothetical protein